MGEFGSGHAFGMHADVLRADPDDDVSRANLIGELKSRGNNAFKGQRFPEAEALYSRAIEHAGKQAETDSATLRSLYGNRSAARCSMGKLDSALEDAEQAAEVDDGWSKAFFRQGQALMAMKRYNAAALTLRPAPHLCWHSAGPAPPLPAPRCGGPTIRAAVSACRARASASDQSAAR